MAIGVVEAIYKLKYFIFLLMKKHREKAKNTGKTQGILSCSEHGNPDKVYDCQYFIFSFTWELFTDSII